MTAPTRRGDVFNPESAEITHLSHLSRPLLCDLNTLLNESQTTVEVFLHRGTYSAQP